MEQTDTKNWRTIVIRTDGFKWVIDSDPSATNSSMLEILEICHQIIDKFDNVK